MSTGSRWCTQSDAWRLRDGLPGVRTVLLMWQKRAASLLIMGALLAGCGGSSAAGEGTRFRKRDLPQPAWLDGTLSRLCLIGLSGGSEDGLACSLETDAVGGGAVFDFSGDGRPDIIWTNAIFGSPVFLENLGGWRFRDVSDIIIGDADWSRVNGVAIGDIDNDGDGDIFFTRQNKQTALLLVNQGGGLFSEESAPRGVAMDDGSPHFGGSAVFGDYDGDGWLDLHTTEHRMIEISPEEPLGHARLFRNLGGDGKPGVFEDVTISSGAGERVSPQVLVHFQSYFHDIDRDGTLDLHIITNHNLSMLLLNNGDGTFRDGSLELPLTNGEADMSAAIGDISGDGIADIFISALSQTPAAVGETRTCEDVRYAEARMGADLSTGNRLFVAEGEGYVDRTDRYGVRNGSWGWGASMPDFANSGRLGLIQVGSRSMPADISFLYCVMPNTTRATVRYWEQNATGELEEISAAVGISGIQRPKSPLTGDFDGDGDEDLVIFETAGVPLLYENTTRGAGDRGITVSFGPDNHPANAVMRVTFTDGSSPLVRIAGVANSLYSSRYTDEIIGLGDRAGLVANLRVDWPNGKTITIEAPKPGERIELP
jgi:enediyne biosynthesis protein E4